MGRTVDVVVSMNQQGKLDESSEDRLHISCALDMSNLAVIDVVPDCNGNEKLRKSILTKLQTYIRDPKGSCKKRPYIIVLRPFGRLQEDFTDSVKSCLPEGQQVYLIVAFSGKIEDTSTIVPYAERDCLEMLQPTSILVDRSGELLNSPMNDKAFKEIAEHMCEHYGMKISKNRKKRKILGLILGAFLIVAIIVIIANLT